MSGDSGKGGSGGQASPDPQPSKGTSSPEQDSGAQDEQDSSAAAENGTSAASQDSGDSGEVQRLRREAAGLRTENKRLREADEARKAAEMSDLERRDARIAALESENAELKKQDGLRTVREAVMESATRLNFRNPGLAYRLIDIEAVEVGDDGKPKGIDRLLNDLAKSDPYLVKTGANGQPDFGAGQRGPTPSDAPSMNELLRRASGH